MTQPPDPLTILQQAVTALTRTVEELARAINGDQSSGSPSLRATIEKMDDRVEKLEQKLRDQETRLSVYIGIAKWAGGGSLLTLAGAVTYLARAGGLHP